MNTTPTLAIDADDIAAAADRLAGAAHRPPVLSSHTAAQRRRCSGAPA